MATRSVGATTSLQQQPEKKKKTTTPTYNRVGLRGFQFGIVNPEELKQYSVTQAITVNGCNVPAGVTRYETFVNGQPVYGGPADPRLGNPHDASDPGYFGHLILARPVYHPGFFNATLRVLHCICFYCSRIRIAEDETIFALFCKIKSRRNRLAALADLLRHKQQCDHCHGWQPKYSKTNLHVSVEFVQDGTTGTRLNGDLKRRLCGATAVQILSNIREQDIDILGLDRQRARPDWLLVQVLPVPPLHVRPGGVAAVGYGVSHQTFQDDLTQQLVNVIKSNLSLQQAVSNGEPAVVVEQLELALQQNVAAFMDNEIRGMPQVMQRDGVRPLKTIAQRLLGMEGRIRGNLVAKRVDFSARTVITVDPNLGIHQVGVPRSVAMNLTVPVRVTEFNINELNQLVANGPCTHPGANRIIRSDETVIDLHHAGKNKSKLRLSRGWTVERHLLDDDIVVLNRQPSWHKMSIMGHRVRVLDGKTFRLNLSCTSAYNAHFDGEQMDMHVPQSLPARAEAELLMSSPRLIVTGSSNRPVMGVLQDSLLAVQKMTKRSVFLEKDLVQNMIMWIGNHWNGAVPVPAILKPKELWTGKQMLSMILPKMNWKGSANQGPVGGASGRCLPNTFNYYDNVVTILEGELLEGIIDKKTIGNSMSGLIHTIWLDSGHEETARFMNQVQQLVNYWILHDGSFSIGVTDVVSDAETMRQIESTIDRAKRQVRDLVRQGQIGTLHIYPGCTMIESFEQLVNRVLHTASHHVGKWVHWSMDETNSVKAMVQSGSSGSLKNISQILSCVGQQNVEGKRIPYGFTKRTLPHFIKDDIGSESRGFVENSFLRGLAPQEFFFHAMDGRNGVVDAACKKAERGYVQRHLVKAMETVMAHYDGTLRASGGQVVQFLYGEDGMDAVWIERQRFDSLTLAKAEFDKRYLFGSTLDPDFGHDNRGMPFLRPETIEDCRRDPEVQLMLHREVETLREDQAMLRIVMKNREPGRESDESSYAPGNVRRVVHNAIRQFSISKRQPSDLHPREVIETVNALLGRLVVVIGDDPLSLEAQNNATTLYRILIRSMLASKRVLCDFRLSKAALAWVAEEIETRFNIARVCPGEMAGVLAAQSIGDYAESSFQDIRHFLYIPGVWLAKEVTLGVPRLKELIKVTKTPTTPAMTVYLQEEVSADRNVVELVVSLLEMVVLGDLVKKTEIYYDPDVMNSVVAQDREFVKAFYEFSDKTDEDLRRLSLWTLRIELEKDLVWMKRIKMDEISTQIATEYGGDLNVEFSDDYADDLVVRVRKVQNAPPSGVQDADVVGRGDDVYLKRLEKCMLANVKLRGVDGIERVFMRGGAKRTIWDDNAGFSIRDEWVLETEGTNLMGVLGVDYVDCSRTISNDIVEVSVALGIEAARRALLYEVRNVISYDGPYVNYRHLACLAEVMTMQGHLMAVDRHIVDPPVGSGLLLRASLEETVNTLLDAAVHAEDEVLQAVSENIMIGQRPRFGTGDIDLLLDDEKL